MSLKHGLWLMFVVFLGAGCGGSGTEPPPPESTVVIEDADPTVVDPDHYSVEFENDRVRVIRIAYGPGEESVMHYHPDSVGVYLTDADVRMTFPDGSTETMTVEAGEHGFYPAGRHLPTNVGDQALELVQVELKGEPAGTVLGGADPTLVDPDHYTAEFENDQVRILRIVYGPGEESVMHDHPDAVAVFLTDHDVLMTLHDGTSSEIVAEAGDALFTPEGQHQPKNVSDQAWELVLVELK